MINKKKLFIILVIASLLLSLTFVGVIFLFKRPVKVSFEVSPNDSLVHIDGNFVFEGSSSIKLPKGEHTVIVSKEGYFQESFPINVKKDTSYKISLTKRPSQTLTKVIDASSFYDLKMDSAGVFFAIDKETNSLGRYDPNTQMFARVSIPNSPPVDHFSIVGENILIRTSSASIQIPPEYYIYSLSNKSIQKIELSAYQPVTSVTLDPNGQVIFLAEYNQRENRANLYTKTPGSNQATLLARGVEAGPILTIPGNKVIIVDSKDAPNQDTANVLDLKTGKLSVLISPPDYIKNPIVHPHEPWVVYLSKDGLTLHNVDSKEKQVLSKENYDNVSLFWFDSQNLMMVNTKEYTLQKINIVNRQVSEKISISRLTGYTLVSAAKAKDGIMLLFISSDGKSLQVGFI